MSPWARHLSRLRRVLPSAAAIVEEQASVSWHRVDWLGQFTGPVLPKELTPAFVVRPGATEEVSEVLRYCDREGLAVVPQGGNTGLVGGGVPCRGDELVLSTSRLNRILDFDAVSGAVTCESGCVLAALQAQAEQHGFIMPLDLGSAGSCQIGGNISTNAGGIRYLRYGSLHANLLGLEVVLADGTVLDLLSTLRKDNTGYDLKRLFVGSEGTLGVITKAAISTPPRPASTNVALLGLDSFADVVAALGRARREVGEVLSALEFWDGDAMGLVLKHCPDVAHADPLGGPERAPYYVLVESSGSNAEHDGEKMMKFLEPFDKGILAATDSQASSLWKIRESITVALRQSGGHTFKYDVSMPTALIDEATSVVRNALAKGGHSTARAYQYGHVGDGNLHLNVFNPTNDEAVKETIENTLYSFLDTHRGSISAEHGIGTLKAAKLAKHKDPNAVLQMRRLKALFDPNNTLNPGKVLL